MLLSFLVGFGVGLIIGSVISIVIDVLNEYLTSLRAKELASQQTGKKITKLIVSSIKNDGVIGESIDVQAFDDNNTHIANITYHAQQGSSLCQNLTY